MDDPEKPQSPERKRHKRKTGAPKGNRNAVGNSGGARPSLYRRQYAAIARRMCEKGATNADLADRFGVSISTIWMWQTQYLEFVDSCRVGREIADARVERSFYERAIGYTFDGEKVFQHDGEIIRAPIREHVPPDPRAGEFWLRNRCPDRWKDARQLETRTADDDPLLAFLKSIDGNVLRPCEPVTIDVTPNVTAPVTNPPKQIDGPPRPIGPGV